MLLLCGVNALSVYMLLNFCHHILICAISSITVCCWLCHYKLSLCVASSLFLLSLCAVTSVTVCCQLCHYVLLALLFHCVLSAVTVWCWLCHYKSIQFTMDAVSISITHSPYHCTCMHIHSYRSVSISYKTTLHS